MEQTLERKWEGQLKDDFFFVRLFRGPAFWTPDVMLTALLWACAQSLPRDFNRIRWWVHRLLNQGASWERCYVQSFLYDILTLIHDKYHAASCGTLIVGPRGWQDFRQDAQKLLDVFLDAGLPISADYPGCPHVSYPPIISWNIPGVREHLASLGADTNFRFVTLSDSVENSEQELEVGLMKWQHKSCGPPPLIPSLLSSTNYSILEWNLTLDDPEDLKWSQMLILRGSLQLHPTDLFVDQGPGVLKSFIRLLAAQVKRVTLVRSALHLVLPYELVEICRRYEFDPSVKRKCYLIGEFGCSADERNGLRLPVGLEQPVISR